MVSYAQRITKLMTCSTYSICCKMLMVIFNTFNWAGMSTEDIKSTFWLVNTLVPSVQNYISF